MADTIMVNGDVHRVMQCGTCGVWHTFPNTIWDHCYREGGHWTCPNGHSRGWAQGAEKEEKAVLRRERDRLAQDAARLHDEIAEQNRKIAEIQKKYQQVRQRAVSGVCPCCNRTFANVQRHMASKHKNVVPLSQKDAG